MKIPENFPALRPGTLAMTHHYGSWRGIETGGKEGVVGCCIFEVQKNSVNKLIDRSESASLLP